MPTLTIDFTAAQATRIQTAFKAAYNVDTFGVPELKQWTIARIKDLVHEEEKKAAAKALPAPASFAPT